MAKKEDITEEIRQLQTMWQMFSHNIENGHDSPMHAPPALVEAVEALGAFHYDQMGLEPEDMNDFKKAMHFAEMMFYFGQYCHQNGLYRSNMTTCDCYTVTDQSLEDFFAGVNFTKEDE
jgi:hypothetical protein